jgi:hypothetical protein
MDRLDEYRQFIQKILESYAQIPYLTEKLKTALLLTANKTIFY